MNNHRTIILLMAAKQAYDDGKLNPDQYLELLDDIEKGIFVSESKKIENEVQIIISRYATT